MSHDRICALNVSVVRINGNIVAVGVPTLISYDGMRFGARARVIEPCKGCMLACFGACYPPSICFRVHVSDIVCRTIEFVLLMYPLYG